MFFKGTYLADDRKCSLFSFYRGDLRHLIRIACKSEWGFPEDIGDPVMHFERLARDRNTLLFTLREGKVVFGYAIATVFPRTTIATFSIYKRKRGFFPSAVECGKLVFDYIFRYDKNVHRIMAPICSENRASILGAYRAGMKNEGRLRNAAIYRGKLVDMECFSYIREEWELWQKQ